MITAASTFIFPEPLLSARVLLLWCAVGLVGCGVLGCGVLHSLWRQQEGGTSRGSTSSSNPLSPAVDTCIRALLDASRPLACCATPAFAFEQLLQQQQQ